MDGALVERENGKKSKQATTAGRFNVKIAALLRTNRSAWTEGVRGLSV